MPRWTKLSLKILGILVCLIMILWMGVAAYVYYNKEFLLNAVSKQVNENLKGRVTIEKMEPSLIRGFPGISVSLENVLVRDSLWDRHKHDLLKAKRAFIAIDAFSILGGRPSIKDVRVQEGEIYLFTDSSGVKNTDIFRKKASSEKKGAKGRIKQVFLDQVVLVVDDKLKNKMFRFNVDKFVGSVKYNSTGWKGKISLNTMVESFAFNLKRGSFLQDKKLNLNWDINFRDSDQRLSFEPQKALIGDDRFEIGGNFMFGGSTDYELNVKAPSILFKDATGLLNPHIISKLKPYAIKSPIFVQASLKGKLRRGGDPLILVNWTVENNTVSALGETMEDCSFTGNYTNELVPGRPRKDPNSIIRVYNMKAKYSGIPFQADSILVSNLSDPVFSGRFRSAFGMKKLNEIIGGETFMFNSGDATLDLSYRAPYDQRDKGRRYIFGNIRVTNAKATYRPRNLAITGMNMNMEFKGEDLLIRRLRFSSGGSNIAMEGRLRNFSNLYYTDPQKILIDWQVSSPKIDLNQFMVFLGRRQSVSTSKKEGGVRNVSRQLDRMLAEASMKMKVNVSRLIYKRFEASAVNAELTLRQSGILLNNVSLKQGGGSLVISGDIDQSGAQNRFHVNSRIRNVNVQRLFYAFENFGQDAITDQNLRGTFSGGTAVTGLMTPAGKIVPRSFRGTIDFDIRNGALVNFEPMTKVGNFAFKNRNFSNIRFTELKNTLTLAGEKVIIPPMEIRSSVLNIFLDGVYSFGTGTNIAIKVPLRNPEKDEMIVDEAVKKERELKGIVINLRALDGDDGKVRFRLGKRTPNGYQ